MADDLGQDWWLRENAAEQRSDASEEEQEEHAKEDAEPKPKKSKKRGKGGERPPEPGEPPSKGASTKSGTKGGGTKQKVPRPEVAVPVIATEEEPKKKRKRKRKTITDVLAASEPARGTPEDLRQSLLAHFQGMLSVVEMEEMALSDASFLPSSDATHTVSSYLKEVCPKWAKLWRSHADTKRPLAIVVCSSALRALDVMRQAAAFKGDCRVAKLFSKHIKVEEQIALLAKQPVHLAAGTPGRIKKILDLDGMTLDSLKYLVLDWNWRDQKLRRLIDIPEVKTDVLELLQKFIIPTARRSSAKIGLF
ncbi:protein CMSS1 isoform X1 [Petromyzon marinus]